MDKGLFFFFKATGLDYLEKRNSATAYRPCTDPLTFSKCLFTCTCVHTLKDRLLKRHEIVPAPEVATKHFKSTWIRIRTLKEPSQSFPRVINEL